MTLDSEYERKNRYRSDEYPRWFLSLCCAWLHRVCSGQLFVPYPECVFKLMLTKCIRSIMYGIALSFIRMCHSEERSDEESMTTNILLLERLVVTDSSLRFASFRMTANNFFIYHQLLSRYKIFLVQLCKLAPLRQSYSKLKN